MSKKISIIGGSGFIGTNLCQILQKKNINFEIIDIKMSNQFANNCIIGDIRDLDSLKKTITGDIVVNLAAVHRDDIDNKNQYYETNVRGAENIITVCNQMKINRIIFTSTVAVYGFTEKATDEKGKINPFNEYGRTKFLAEEKFRFWQKSNSNSLIIIRPTVVFGEGNRGNVYNLLNQIKSGKFLMIGQGNNKKSMAYVKNIAAFIEKCIETKIDYGLFNYVDTPDFKMNELVRIVRKELTGKDNVGIKVPYWFGLIFGFFADIVSRITGKNFPISSLRVKKFVSSTEFKTAKSNLDNFVSPYSLKEGIKKTLKSEFITPDPKREIFNTY